MNVNLEFFAVSIANFGTKSQFFGKTAEKKD